MLNPDQYLRYLEEKSAAQPPEPEAGVVLITDPAEIEAFEQQSGLTAGILPNAPYYDFCMDVYRSAKTNQYYRYCNVVYSKQGAAVLVLLRTEQQAYFLLNRQYRPLLRKIVYEIPRGFSDPTDPNAAYTAIRELAEETNINLSEAEEHSFQMTELGTLHPDSGLTNNHAALFLAELRLHSAPELAVQDVNETILGHLLVTEQQLSEMIADDRITDAFTLAAYARYQSRKGTT